MFQSFYQQPAMCCPAPSHFLVNAKKSSLMWNSWRLSPCSTQVLTRGQDALPGCSTGFGSTDTALSLFRVSCSLQKAFQKWSCLYNRSNIHARQPPVVTESEASILRLPGTLGRLAAAHQVNALYMLSRLPRPLWGRPSCRSGFLSRWADPIAIYFPLHFS